MTFKFPTWATAPVLTVGLALAGAATATAQEWPTDPVQIIVSYGAGGGSDRQARLLSGPLSDELGVPVTVQNMPGGGGQVAAAALLRSNSDEPVLLATNEPDLTMGPEINGAPFSRDDLTVLAVDVTDPRILLVAKDSPYQSFAEFVAAARETPGEITISAAQGGAQELFAKWLVKALDLDVPIVGYEGGSAAANGMLGGHVTAALGDDFARLNLRDDTRALLIAAPQKSPRWQEAELLTDAMEAEGLEAPAPDFLARYGLYAVKSDMSEEHRAILQEAILAAMASEEYVASVEEQGLEDLSLRAAGDAYEESFRASVAAAREATE